MVNGQETGKAENICNVNKKKSNKKEKLLKSAVASFM